MRGKKFPRYRPRCRLRVGRGIGLPFLDCGIRRGWVVNSTPQPHFTPGKDPVPIVQEAGWAPGPVWTAENLAPPGLLMRGRGENSRKYIRQGKYVKWKTKGINNKIGNSRAYKVTCKYIRIFARTFQTEVFRLRLKCDWHTRRKQISSFGETDESI
jgi:hypothetical protein